MKSVSAIKRLQNKIYYKKGKDKLIRNYGLGAQILKNLKVNKMILVTKSKKKVIGLEGYNLSITKQEIMKICIVVSDYKEISNNLLKGAVNELKKWL